MKVAFPGFLASCLVVLLLATATAFAAAPAGDEDLVKWAASHPKFLKRFDANHNGKLDGPELSAARPAWQKKLAAKVDRDDNPPGPKGGKGTNWENPPGPKGGPGASPNKPHKKAKSGK